MPAKISEERKVTNSPSRSSLYVYIIHSFRSHKGIIRCYARQRIGPSGRGDKFINFSFVSALPRHNGKVKKRQTKKKNRKATFDIPYVRAFRHVHFHGMLISPRGGSPEGRKIATMMSEKNSGGGAITQSPCARVAV